MMKKTFLKLSGFTFVETIVAVGIMVIVMISVTQIITSTVRYLYSTDTRLSAMTLAREGLESVRNIRDTFIDGNTSSYFTGYDFFSIYYPANASHKSLGDTVYDDFFSIYYPANASHKSLGDTVYDDFYNISYDTEQNISLLPIADAWDYDSPLNHFGEAFDSDAGDNIKYWRWINISDLFPFYLKEINHTDSNADYQVDSGESVTLVFSKDVRETDIHSGFGTIRSVVADGYQNNFSLSSSGPVKGDIVWIGVEKVLVLAVSDDGLEIYVTRGYGDTTPTAHLFGASFTFHNLDSLFPNSRPNEPRSWGGGATFSCSSSECTIVAGNNASFTSIDRINPVKVFSVDNEVDATGGRGPSFGAVMDDPSSPGDLIKIPGFSAIRHVVSVVCWEDQYGNCENNQISMESDLEDSEAGFDL